jgi:hypothetical protein
LLRIHELHECSVQLQTAKQITKTTVRTKVAPKLYRSQKVIHLKSIWKPHSTWTGVLSLTRARSFVLSLVEKIISWTWRIPTSFLLIFECEFWQYHEPDDTITYLKQLKRMNSQVKLQIQQ